MRDSKLFRFDASHILPRHKGRCSRLHGHSWRLIVDITGRVQKETGFVVDFGDIKTWVQPLIDLVDHRHLNSLVRYPSSENMAIWFAHEIRARIPYPQSKIIERLVIKVSETENTWAEFDTADPHDLHDLDHSPTDAEWRSPTIEKVLDIPAALDDLRQSIPMLYKAFEEALTRKEQLDLYVQTMNAKPDLPDFSSGVFSSGERRGEQYTGIENMRKKLTNDGTDTQ